MEIFDKYVQYYENNRLPGQEEETRTAEDMAVLFTEMSIIRGMEEEGHLIEGEEKQQVLGSHYKVLINMMFEVKGSLETREVRDYDELVDFILELENNQTEQQEQATGLDYLAQLLNTDEDEQLEDEQQADEQQADEQLEDEQLEYEQLEDEQQEDEQFVNFNFEFGDNNFGEDSGIPIMRRGSGESINQMVNDEQEDIGNENNRERQDFGGYNSMMEFELEEGTFDRNPFEPEEDVREETRPQERPRLNQQEERDNQNILNRHQMISRFSNGQGREEVRRDARGNTEIDYGTTILMSFEEESRKDEALFAESVEVAIDHLHSMGFVYEKRLNIFVRTGQSGHREYARIFLDLDFRGLLG